MKRIDPEKRKCPECSAFHVEGNLNGTPEQFRCIECGHLYKVMEAAITPEDEERMKKEPMCEEATMTEKYETEREHTAFLEKLLRVLYGDGWNHITIHDARIWHDKNFPKDVTSKDVTSKMNEQETWINDIPRVPDICSSRDLVDWANEIVDHLRKIPKGMP